jgi:peptidoglycan hydrolase-like protein with peptidoglycan-binding domain
LVEDGDFGRRTREAVESFQREHGLEVDGRVGRDTREALAKPHGTRITDTRHPDYALFEHLLGKVQAAEAERGLPSGAHSMGIAAALAVQVRESGLPRVDRVELNDDAKLVRAVHSPTGRWEQELTTRPIDTTQASTYSLHVASDRLAELARSRQQEVAERQRHPAPVFTQ